MSKSSDNDGLTLAAVGQALIKRNVLDGASAETTELVGRLRAADFAFTNLEGAIAGRHGGWPMKDKAVAALPASVLDTLRNMGFGLLSLANNHASDLGPGGILSTIEEARLRGFTVAGTGADAEAAAAAGIGVFKGRRVGLVAIDAGPWGDHVWAGAARPGVNRLKVQRRLQLLETDVRRLAAIAAELGHEQRVETRARLGFQMPAPQGALDFFGTIVEPGAAAKELMVVDEADLARHERVIAQAAANTDLLVVYLHNHHWPADMMRPPEWMRGVARRLLEAGGDVFLSHGAPVLQEIELVSGKPAAYGLGNFIFHSSNRKVRAAPEVWRSGLVSFRFEGRRIAAIDVQAIALGDPAQHDDVEGNRDAPRLWRGPAASAYLESWLARAKAPAASWRIDEGTARLVTG